MLRAAAFAAALGVASAFSSQQLWAAYSGPAECYRQPVLVTLPNNEVLAFTQGRNDIGWCSGTFWPDNISFPLLVRKSVDGGSTFGETVTVLPPDNYDFYTAVFDPATGIVHVTIQYGDDGVMYLTSADGGATWSAPSALAINGQFASIIPGVGHGIALSPKYCLDPTCGGAAGRLLMPFVCTSLGPVSNDTACGNCLTCLLASDDHGATWGLTALSAQQGSREAALVQLDTSSWASNGAVVYAGERNLGNQTGSRWHAVSTDSGRTFSTYGSDPELPDSVDANWTGVVSGLARFDTPEGDSVLVFTAPADRTARQDLTLYASYDGGVSWVTGPTLWAGPAAYSDTIQVNSTHVGVLFECGVSEFAGGINFGLLTVADLPPKPTA